MFRKNSSAVFSLIAVFSSFVVATAAHADEADMCAEAGIDMIQNYYGCLEFLDQQVLSRYPDLVERNGELLTLLAENERNMIVPNDTSFELSLFYVVAHFPEHRLSLVNESGHDYSSRHLFNHANGQFIEVYGWPAFSASGDFVAFFRGGVWDSQRMLAIYRLQSSFVRPTTSFFAASYWFSDALFTSDTELLVTINCRVIPEGQLVPGNRTEQMTLNYDGNIWHPSDVETCNSGVVEP